MLCDLRGYGDSSKPADKPDHSQQSKRPMALDGVEVMEHLGFRQFRMVGHDRGGRVGRRMAIDHPDRVLKLAVLDIVPAHYLYSHVTLDFVRGYPHWFSYLLPAPGPENDLVAAAKRQAERATNDVQRESLRHRVKFEMEHCMCEDYRASASVDLKIDQADHQGRQEDHLPPAHAVGGPRPLSAAVRRCPGNLEGGRHQSQRQGLTATTTFRKALPRKRWRSCRPS